VLALSGLCLAVALLAGYLAQASAAPGAATVSRAAYAPLRQYYLTQNSDYNGSQPKGACADGYHMASLWEILDPSGLRYNTSLGEDRADSGMGPPSYSFGWVRTGYGSDSSAVAGQANCDVWSSTSGYGTVVALPADWTPSAQDIHVWDASFRSCSSTAAVWCVEDPGEPHKVYLPLVLR
jgi:hypothetical protein